VSNCAINIRIWHWHWQVTFNNEWSWSINEHWYENKPWINPKNQFLFMILSHGKLKGERSEY